MKRKIYLFITGVMVTTTLAGCGGGSGYKSSETAFNGAPSFEASDDMYYDEAYASDDMYYEKGYAESPMMEEAAGSSNAGIESVDDETVANTNRKIIRNVNIDAETEEFDSFIANITAKVTALDGYMESTNISGRSINSSKSNMRNASLTARIPAKNLDNFITNVSEISNIINKSESADDVTLSYADTQAHIKSLRTEQERLDQLLLQADDIETIIAIESRITDVRYELESYESRLRTMDNKVDYSTVYISVKEVERYTPVEVHKPTVWERISVGFTDNLLDAKDFLVDIFVGFIVAIPILVVLLLFLAVPVIIILLIIRGILISVNGPGYKDELKAKRALRKAKKDEYKKKQAEEKKNNAAKKASAKSVKETEQPGEGQKTEVKAKQADEAKKESSEDSDVPSEENKNK